MVKIIGLGTCLPGEPIPNSKMEEVFFLREDWIDQMIGTKTRHLAVDLDEKQAKFSLAELCTKAAQAALADANLTPDEIDFIVMSTATPDHLMPATVNLVADMLGANHVPTYQVQAGCSGALQGMDVARRFLQGEEYSTALVIGGDVINKYLDFRRDFKKMRSSELINLALFGDGAGACVLTNKEERSGIRIESIANRFEGLEREPGQIMNWFGTIVEAGERDAKGKKIQAAKEDYKAIETHVPQMAKDMIAELLEKLQWQHSDVTYYLPPQLGGHMTDRIVQFLEIEPERAVNVVALTGNNGNALPYIQMEKLARLMKSGDKAVGVAIESSKWVKTGIALTKE